jgi:hypothetical protein
VRDLVVCGPDIETRRTTLAGRYRVSQEKKDGTKQVDGPARFGGRLGQCIPERENGLCCFGAVDD